MNIIFRPIELLARISQTLSAAADTLTGIESSLGQLHVSTTHVRNELMGLRRPATPVIVTMAGHTIASKADDGTPIAGRYVCFSKAVMPRDYNDRIILVWRGMPLTECNVYIHDIDSPWYILRISAGQETLLEGPIKASESLPVFEAGTMLTVEVGLPMTSGMVHGWEQVKP